MDKSEVARRLRKLYNSLPRFGDGRIDYTNSDVAVVVTVFVVYKGKVLLLKRSQGVLNYKGLWNGVGGYVDRLVPPEKVALKEIREELGIKKANVLRVNSGLAHALTDRKLGRKWIICPFIVEVRRKPAIRLDWENTAYRWVTPSKLKGPDRVPGLNITFVNANK